jgi:4-amino-4-deoxy-L-arabinose transferase-like glycosyltransferase
MVWVIQRLSSQRSHLPVGVAQLWIVRRQDTTMNNNKTKNIKRVVLLALFAMLGIAAMILVFGAIVTFVILQHHH